MKTEDIIKRYDEKRKEIQEYMTMLVNTLDEKYSGVPESFIISLDLLAFNLDVLFKSMDEMKEKGMTETDKYRGEKKSGSMQAFFNSQNYITKILASFGFSPASASKIRESHDELDIKKYLEAITDNEQL